jgi:signal transduction histidine kinase
VTALVPLRFRHRIGLLVALAAAALITVTAVALVLGRHGEKQLAGIETRYVPLLELDRDLKTLFSQIQRALEDAASAAEDSRLSDADTLYATMTQRLREGSAAIAENGGDAAALELELDAYYRHARAVASALVTGVSAAQLGERIEAMGRAHRALGLHLDAAASPDRRRLAAAFATARATQRDALWIDIVVAVSALVLIGLWSWRLIRQTVGALHAVALGVERIAHGDFAHEIEVATSDELGDLAREANQTAARLRAYRDQAQHQAAELRDAYATVEARNATLVAAQQLLEDRASDLARASRHKSEFLASMSHELRTPLNSVMVLSQVLAENHGSGGAGGGSVIGAGGMTAKQIELAQLIHKSGEELLALINEVLDLAKIEAGKQVLECDAVRLIAVDEYVRRMFQPLAVQRGLAFEVASTGELPAAIRTDWARLAQILKNLLSNAFKFTERGRVAVRISRELPEVLRESEIVEPIAIAVSDTGIGIDPDKLGWIFEAFAQADTGIARKFGGTGLGLTIAKQLAIRLGGDLVVTSAPGVGTTFTLVLPAAGPGMGTEDAAQWPSLPRTVTPSRLATLPSGSSASARLRALTPSLPPVVERPSRASLVQVGGGDAGAPDPVLMGKTVLVVDDDMRHVYSLSGALRARRLEVISAADGQEALDELERHPALDVIVMDMMMPRIDGNEVIRRIRAQPRFQTLPIIALTAKRDPGDREACLAAGATDYVAKPVDIVELLALLRTRLGG